MNKGFSLYRIIHNKIFFDSFDWQTRKWQPKQIYNGSSPGPSKSWFFFSHCWIFSFFSFKSFEHCAISWTFSSTSASARLLHRLFIVFVLIELFLENWISPTQHESSAAKLALTLMHSAAFQFLPSYLRSWSGIRLARTLSRLLWLVGRLWWLTVGIKLEAVLNQEKPK